MAATALLCVLLPTFREMELPSTIIVSPDCVDIKYCRPIFQPRVWRLMRDCLGRCGGSATSAEANTVNSGGGRGTSLLSSGKIDDRYDRSSMDQLLRRRSAHALRLMLEYKESGCSVVIRASQRKIGRRREGREGDVNRKMGTMLTTTHHYFGV